MEFKIGNTLIGDNHPTFIVAEMSANHNGSLDEAIEIVRAAKRSGANAIKIQTYTADTITINSSKRDFLISKDSPWASYKTLWNLYDTAHTPWEWHDKIFNEAKRLGLEFFSSPFDDTAVDFLEEFNVGAYKIASPEITNIPLIKKVAKTGKPVIISSGLSEFDDLDLAVKTLKQLKSKNICILKCTSAYPTPVNEINLLTIPDIITKFNVISGLSDHTLGSVAPIANTLLGGAIIEKHLALDNQNTVDSFFSLEETEFKKMVDDIRYTEQALGSVNYKITKSASQSIANRSSLYVCKNIKKGEIFTKDNIKAVRPGLGLHPKYLDDIIGKNASKDIEIGERLSWDLIKE